MKTYNEIRSELESKNYSLSEIKKSIFFFSIIRFLFTESFLFVISIIPFLIGYYIITLIYGFSTVISLFYLLTHILFYFIYVKGQYKKYMLHTLIECEMMIKAFKEIKRNKKSLTK